MTDLLTNTTAAKVRSALAKAYLKDPVEASVNAYLINAGSKLVLIDAGAGALGTPFTSSKARVSAWCCGAI